MNTTSSRLLRCLSSLVLGALCLAPVAALANVDAKPNSATVPAPRNTWIIQHDRQKAAAVRAKPEVVFIGDSITAGWASRGKKNWEASFAKLPSVNLGISGDRTENVIWRLQDGLLDNISPKVAVVMIGTNNTWVNEGDEIAEGVQAVVNEIRARSPETKVLLLGIFPRGEKPSDPRRQKVAKANESISKLGDGQNVFYMDISDRFIQPDGTIAKADMYDFLHLTPAGYQIWTDAIEGKVNELLQL